MSDIGVVSNTCIYTCKQNQKSSSRLAIILMRDIYNMRDRSPDLSMFYH